VLWAAMTGGFSRSEHVEMYRRTIPIDIVRKALTVFLFYLIAVVIFTIILLATDGFSLLQTLFETVSAVATVGLSTGITPELSKTGRILITILMFIGRLGPLTIVYALVLGHARAKYAYAEERMMIG